MAGATERKFLPDHASDARCLEEVLDCFPKEQDQPAGDTEIVVAERIDTACESESGIGAQIRTTNFHLVSRPDFEILETIYPHDRTEYRLTHRIRDTEGEIQETRTINFLVSYSAFGIRKPRVCAKGAYIASNHHQQPVTDHDERCRIVDEMVEYLCFGDETGCSSVG